MKPLTWAESEETPSRRLFGITLINLTCEVYNRQIQKSVLDFVLSVLGKSGKESALNCYSYISRRANVPSQEPDFYLDLYHQWPKMSDLFHQDP